MIIFSLILSFTFFPGVEAVHQAVRGYIRYSDDTNVPNNVIVTITDTNNGNSMTRTTQQAGGGPGYYLIDVEDLSASDGHTILVNVSYGGCEGDNSIVVDVSNPPQYCNITISGNLPPITPSQPSGSTSGDHGLTFIYSTSATDPDGDDLYYWFDWGDNTNSGWVGPYPSGSTVNVSHIWNSPGNFTVKTKAKDEHGAERGEGWSDDTTVTMVNKAPTESTSPTGITSGYSLVRYTFLTNATDPNGDDLYYWFDWGDNTNSGWVGPHSSGSTGSASVSYTHLRAHET